MTDATPVLTAAEPTHACVRCGAPIALGEAMCERCNPLGLSQPAASQAHGTVFLAVVLGVVVLAVLGRMAVSGVGPFTGSVASVAREASGLSVTLTISNTGTRAGATTCRIAGVGSEAAGPESAFIESPQIAAGGTVSFSRLVTGLGTEVRPLSVTCSSP
jgi:predicted nucleic acid-binding Zn ribbon protein